MCLHTETHILRIRGFLASFLNGGGVGLNGGGVSLGGGGGIKATKIRFSLTFLKIACDAPLQNLRN